MELAEDIINPVQRNKELLLSEFAAELKRKIYITRANASRNLRASNISALKAFILSVKNSEFIVGKKKKHRKKEKYI